MPVGLTKETFREFTKYYDEEVFRGVADSIRAKAFDYYELRPTERIQAQQYSVRSKTLTKKRFLHLGTW